MLSNKIRKKNLYVSIAISFLLLISMFYNIYSKNKEFVVEDNLTSVSSHNRMVDENGSENLNNEALFRSLSNEESAEKTVETDKVTVFVSGEIKNPQVITLENGKRLIDAVELCGGLTTEADINQINLSIKLKEESHYVIPKKGEVTVSKNASNSLYNNLSSVDSQGIDINRATLEEIKTLPGIGEALGVRIIEKREEIGGFKSIEELLTVPGIGEKKFEAIKDKIVIF